MTACIVTEGHLVGRYENSNTSLTYPGGDFDITLNSAQDAFDGFFTADDPSFPGQFPYSGTFVSHFPGDGCCVTTPPAGEGLSPPTSFCPEAARGPAGFVALKCANTTLVTQEEKAQARKDLRVLVKRAALMCSFRSPFEHISFLEFLLVGCPKVVGLIGQTLTIVHDPPDRSFRLPTLPPAVAPVAGYAGRRCPKGLGAAKCAALKAAVSNYADAVAATASVAEYVAIGANRLTGAVQANSPESAFLQQAFGKVNAGALATDLAPQQAYGRALAKLLRADHLDVRLSARQVEKTMSHLPSEHSALRSLRPLS